jgi:imidazole glycerol-phosphate synthase subunit HisH
MIAIVDYGAGNLNSVKKAFDYLGAEVVVTDQPATVAAADKIVLPGVGIFLLCKR